MLVHNLSTENLQLDFVNIPSDVEPNFNIIHWYSARAPRRPCPTEESEVKALCADIKTLRIMNEIVFQLLKKKFSYGLFDDRTVRDNLMNSTVPSISEVYYCCREVIQKKVVNSVCLVPGSESPADVITKARDNGKLKMAIKLGNCVPFPTRVFMLKTSRYRIFTFIPTSSVPMLRDDQLSIDTWCFTSRRGRNVRYHCSNGP